MPGLAFLGKKSWHTSNLKNVEQVWLAEKKADDEKKKLDELKKQITEERQILELRQLQVASGQIVKSVDTTLDWMYEGPSAQAEQSAEYLLGKIYKPQGNEKTDIHKIQKDPGSLWLNKVSSKNDTFTRLHEDPLLLIKQNEVNASKMVLNNPVKMARIQQQIAAELEQAEQEKRERKARKKQKKENKKRDRSRSRSHSEPRGSRTGGRTDDSFSRPRKRSRSPSAVRGSLSARDSNDRYAASADRHRDDYDRVSGHRGSDAQGLSPGRDRDRSGGYDDSDDNSTSQPKRFGLIRTGVRAAADPDRDRVDSCPDSRSSLGPNAALLAKKKAEVAMKEETDRQKRARSGGAKGISEEDRRRRLMEMERDAAMYDQQRSTKITREKRSYEKEVNSNSNSKDGTFLSDMRSGVYNNAETSMEDRLKRNRHYQQRSSDLDSQGFLKK